MKATRAFVLALLVAVSMVVVPLSATGSVAPSPSADGTQSPTAALEWQPQVQEREDDPNTSDTVGYVEGYWYDDELPVDDRDDAVLEDDELEAVTYRAMARVEVIRELTFEEEVPVEVISREEFEERNEELFAEFTESERLYNDVRFETLFMVDRDTDASDEYRALYSGAVAGYYDPADGRVAIVSDDPEELQMDEIVLAHELLHALQDQHFDLGSFEKETRDQANAKDGLIEGDAVYVEREYELRCEEEWDCLPPVDVEDEPPEVSWGMYFTVYQPYDDGPDYVEHLLEQGGWEAVNDSYDDPPASTSEVIRPGEEREPVEITIEDRSSDRWERLEIDGEPNHSSFGEATMAAMFADGALDPAQGSVVSYDEFVTTGSNGYLDEIQYDQPYTDGWAGDRHVTYVAGETVDETGYVWQTEWISENDAEEFLGGYLELLELHGAEPVIGHENTFTIDDGFPGAYYVDHEGETVTIVRAPSVDELPEVHEGAAPTGENTFDFDDATAVGSDDDAVDDAVDDAEPIPGFGVALGLVASGVAILLALAAVRRR